jgi:hypothetical protein
MMSDDDLKRALGELPVGDPPAGFVDQVLAARRAEQAAAVDRLLESSRAPRRRRPLLLAGFVAVIVAATIGLFVLTRNQATPASLAGGADSVDERRSLAIGERAVAVAEPGAGLSWKLSADGGALVEQKYGSVFYRVDHGGLFVVDTPAGQVQVLGTCFRVEVDPMNPLLKSVVSAGAGAIVATAVVVTVYEGKVRVSNASGVLDVRPGESASLRDGQAPARLDTPSAPVASAGPSAALLAAPPADVTREQLLVRDGQQREQLATLDGRVRQLEAEKAALASKKPGGPDEPREGRHKVHGFTPEEWAEMAEKCEVRFDLPQFGLNPPKIPARQAAAMGISDDQRIAMESVLGRMNSQYMSTVRGLYVEVTGDTAGADNLEPLAMVNEMEHKSPPGSSSAARKRVALERAGKVAPPADPQAGPAIERLMRYVLGVSDDTERELAAVVGAEKAAVLRDKGFGHRSAISGCNDNDE